MARRLKLDMLLDYQKCRTWGHAWEDFTPMQGSKRPAPWGRRFSLRCIRCGMERHDVFDGLGRLSIRDYDPPPDYKVAAGERPSIEQLRLSVASQLADEIEAPKRNGHTPRKAPAKKAPAKKRRGHLVAV